MQQRLISVSNVPYRKCIFRRILRERERARGLEGEFMIMLHLNSALGYNICYLINSAVLKLATLSNVDINYCEPNPCQNGGTCNSQEDVNVAYICSCRKGYEGTHCEKGRFALHY